MSRKIAGSLIILAGVALTVIFYFLFFGIDKKEIDNASRTVETSRTSAVRDGVTTDGGAAAPAPVGLSSREFRSAYVAHKVGEDDLKKMALLFVDRFGSYSNQSNFSNIEDLKIFMSERMINWAEAFIAERRNKQQSEKAIIYYSVTTKSVIAETKKIDEAAGMADILVKTRRRESMMSANNSSKTFNQDILLSFKREGGVWKVDAAYWKDKGN